MLPYKRQYFSVNNFQKSKPKNDKHDRGKNDYGDSNLNNKNYSNCPNSQISLRSYSIMIITEVSRPVGMSGRRPVKALNRIDL